MPQIAIFLPNAVSIRDIVHTGTLRELLRIPDAAVQIYTQNPDLPEFDELRASGKVTLLPIGDYRPKRAEVFVRRIYPVLYYDVFVYLQHAFRGRPFNQLIARSLSGARRIFGNGRSVRAFGRLLLAMSQKVDPPVIQGTPDLAICTRSLVASLEFPVICEARRRGLPLLTAVSSWDNFTTKGFLPFPVEKSIVWNRKMAEELHELFDVPREDIVIGGFPRLMLLENRGPFETAEQYLAQLGLGQYRRFVLYSVSYGELTRVNEEEPPKEYQLVREVTEQLVPTLPDDVCVIIRLHPYTRLDDEAYFAGMERVKVFVPGRMDKYVERVMNDEDEHHFAAQLQLSECVISLASTVTIDALSLGRPIVNVAFEPGSGEGDAICKYYQFNHFADLLRITKAPLARDAAAVIAFVHRCLAGDKDPGIDAAAFTEYYVPSFSHDYPRIMRETVEEALRRGQPSR